MLEEWAVLWYSPRMDEPGVQENTPLASTTKAWLSNVAGLLWFGSLELLLLSSQNHLFGWLAVGMMVLVLVGVIIMEFRWTTIGRGPFVLFGSLIIAAASSGLMFFSGTVTASISTIFRQLPAHLTAITGAIALTAWLHHSQRQVVDPLRGRFAVFIMALSIWAGVYSGLSWAVFMGLQPWWLAIGGAALLVLTGWVVWQDAGIPWTRFRWPLVVSALFGAETVVVSWWLPTPLAVGATVATTMMVLYLQVNRHLWLNSWHPGRGRRYLWTGTAIIILSLLTARWI